MKTVKILIFIIMCFGFDNTYAQSTLQVRGLTDLVAQGDDDKLYLNQTFVNDSNFDALRARIFIEGGTERTNVFIQTLFSQRSFMPFRLYGAYLMHRVFEEREVFLEAGLIPVHDGVWAPNTYSNKNPLIGIPMGYYWKTTMSAYQMPVDIDQVVSMKGQGQAGFEYADSSGVRGRQRHSAPVIYDNCWNLGAYSIGVLNNFEYALGVTVGAPADPVQTTDTNENISVHAKMGYAITPGLQVHLSGAIGAYMSNDVAPYLPAGKTVNDYLQRLLIGSVQWQWRYLETVGEFIWNTFDTPVYSDPLHSTSFWVQGVYKFRPGWYVAVRYDDMRFMDVQTSAGVESWDQDIYRVESGIGYNVSRELITKFVIQQTNTGDGWQSENLVPAIQASFAF